MEQNLTQRKRRRIPGNVEGEITELALTTRWSPAQIYRDISSREELMADVPHQRTVERIVRDVRRRDGEKTLWTLAVSDGEEAKYVLEARRALILHQEKAGLHRFSREEAQWVAKILKIAPDLAPDVAWLVAQVYRHFCPSGEEQEVDDIIDALDDYLAFAPWRNPDRYQIYIRAVEEGWIPATPMWNRLVVQQNPMSRKSLKDGNE